MNTAQGQHGSVIVVGVDGSRHGGEAFRWALREARLRGARLRVVHAWSIPPLTLAGVMPASFEHVREGLRSTAAVVLESELEGAGDDATDVDVERLVVKCSTGRSTPGGSGRRRLARGRVAWTSRNRRQPARIGLTAMPAPRAMSDCHRSRRPSRRPAPDRRRSRRVGRRAGCARMGRRRGAPAGNVGVRGLRLQGAPGGRCRRSGERRSARGAAPRPRAQRRAGARAGRRIRRGRSDLDSGHSRPRCRRPALGCLRRGAARRRLAWTRRLREPGPRISQPALCHQRTWCRGRGAVEHHLEQLSAQAVQWPLEGGSPSASI